MVKKSLFILTVFSLLLLVFVTACSSASSSSSSTAVLFVKTPATPTVPTTSLASTPASNLSIHPMSTTAKEPILLTVTHIQPVGSTFDGIMKAWANSVEQASNGKLKLVVYPMQTFCYIPDTYKAVSNGLVDIALTYSGFSPGRFPRGTVMQLPSAPWAVDSPLNSVLVEKLFEEGYISDELQDVKVLWCFSNASPSRFHFTKPVRTLADLKGKKIRVSGTVVSKMTEALGAIPVNMSPDDVYTGLERGIVDGASFPWEAAVSYKIYEVAKYHLTEPGTADYFFVVMNKNKWNSLPFDVQNIITNESGEVGAKFIGEEWMKYDAKAVTTMKASGNAFIDLSPEDHQKWVSMVKPVWDWWLSDMKSKKIDGQKILDAAQKIWGEINK